MWSEVVNGRVQVTGLLHSDAEVDGVKGTVERLNYAVDNEAVASSLACQTLDMLNQLGKVNAIVGANRPVVSTARPVIRTGETAEVVASGALIAKRFIYSIQIDGTTNTAVVEHETGIGQIKKQFFAKGSAPGWEMFLVLASPRELPALNTLNQTTLDQLNFAIETERASAANRNDLQIGYQLVRRIS
jgi:hypothetical protein